MPGLARLQLHQVAGQIEQFLGKGLAVSVVSLAELYEGIYRSSQPEANDRILKDFLGIVTVLKVAPDVAQMYGRIRSDLLKKGTVIGALDVGENSTEALSVLWQPCSPQHFSRPIGQC